MEQFFFSSTFNYCTQVSAHGRALGVLFCHRQSVILPSNQRMATTTDTHLGIGTAEPDEPTTQTNSYRSTRSRQDALPATALLSLRETGRSQASERAVRQSGGAPSCDRSSVPAPTSVRRRRKNTLKAFLPRPTEEPRPKGPPRPYQAESGETGSGGAGRAGAVRARHWAMWRCTKSTRACSSSACRSDRKPRRAQRGSRAR